jgi:hypothetical protein
VVGVLSTLQLSNDLNEARKFNRWLLIRLSRYRGSQGRLSDAGSVQRFPSASVFKTIRDGRPELISPQIKSPLRRIARRVR